ncbi:winged helix-turn-helix domain-containing protein [Halorarius litoreus]|uniref:winged helix-turn-helix domain-containing protein n=1 Tax=Halorarius litoreus TaxID=2962676 RepID=UPI0020CD8EB7|nr:helix-turn-helix domain-containing protein [Halorarius litoreus]
MATDSRLAPEEAFAALGNELRVTVLRVLAEAAADAATDDERGLSFTEIYDRVDIDSTSQLSYHLDKLDGMFVRRSPDGYRLTQAGDRVVRAVRSGTYTATPTFPRTELDGRCHACRATTLVAEYRDPLLVVDCTACDTRVVTYDLPPAESVDRTPLEVLQSCDQRVHHEYGMALQGTCAMCGGRTEVSTRTRDPPDDDASTDDASTDGAPGYLCVAACRSCQHEVYAPLEVRLLYHPAVVSFYWQQGVDASTIPFWNVATYLTDWRVDRVSTDPDRFHVTVVYSDERLHLAVDDELAVSVRPPDANDSDA